MYDGESKSRERPPMRQLEGGQPVFVGFAVESGFRRELLGLTGPDQKYVSTDETTFLTLCELDGTVYVGKLVEDRLTTDRIEDVKRNVHSILRRLFPEQRLPDTLSIVPCGVVPSVEPEGPSGY